MTSNIGEAFCEGKVDNLNEEIIREKVANVAQACPQENLDNTMPIVNDKDIVGSEKKLCVLSQSQEASEVEVDQNANFSNTILEHKVKSDPAYIYVGELPLNVSETYLRDTFRKYGNIGHVKLLKSRCNDEQHSYIYFQYRQNAERAIKAMNGSQMFTKTIVVQWAERLKSVLFVGGLSCTSDKTAIKQLFEKYGEVNSVQLFQGYRPYAFVEFGKHANAKKAIEALHQKKWLDQTLTVRVRYAPGNVTKSDMSKSLIHPSKQKKSPSDMAKSLDLPSKLERSLSDKDNCLDDPSKLHKTPSDQDKRLDHSSNLQGSPSNMAKNSDQPSKPQESLSDMAKSSDHPSKPQVSRSDEDKCLDHSSKQQTSPSDMVKSSDHQSSLQESPLKEDQCLNLAAIKKGSPSDKDQSLLCKHNQQGSPSHTNHFVNHPSNQQGSLSNIDKYLDRPCNQQVSPSDMAQCIGPLQCSDPLNIHQGSPSDMGNSLDHMRSKINDNVVIASKKFPSTPQHEKLKKFQLSKESSVNQSINKRFSSIFQGYSLVSAARAEEKEKISGMKYILEVSIKDEMESLSKALHRFETDKGVYNAKTNFEKKMLEHLKLQIDRALTVDWSKLASLYNVITPYASFIVEMTDPEVLARIKLDEERSMKLEKGMNGLMKDLRNMISTFEEMEEGGNVQSVPDVEESLRKIEACLDQSVLALDEEMLNWAGRRIDDFLDEIGLAWNLVQSDPNLGKALEQQENPLKLFRREIKKNQSTKIGL